MELVSASTSFSSIGNTNVNMKSNSNIYASPKTLSYSAQLGKNISKVRWINSGHIFSIPDRFATEHFLVGTWSEDKNEVSLWKYSTDESGDSNALIVQKEQVNGDVTGLCCIDSDNFALTTSFGELMTFKLQDQGGEANEDAEPNSQSLAFNLSSNLKLHFARNKVGCPATGVISNTSSIVSVGEDGSIFEISHQKMNIVRSLVKVESLSISCVAFTGRKEIATGNSSGQLKLWDLRSDSGKPTHVMTPNSPINCQSGAVSVAPHPSQSSIIFVGYNDGSIDVWDSRKYDETEPVANVPPPASGSFGAISEFMFHPFDSDVYFTCLQSGEVCQWFPSNTIKDFRKDLSELEFDRDLNIEFLHRGLDFKLIYRSILPCNSMSISPHNRIICGGDSGIIHCSELRI